MRNATKRITFRMDPMEFEAYDRLRGKFVGVKNWTDLVLKALHELLQMWEGNSSPLGVALLPSSHEEDSNRPITAVPPPIIDQVLDQQRSKNSRKKGGKRPKVKPLRLKTLIGRKKLDRKKRKG